MMATYNVSFEYSLMGSVYIEAESEEEAKEVFLNKYDGRCEKLPEDSRASFEDMELEESHGLGRNDIGFLLGTLDQIGRHPSIVNPLYDDNG